MYSRQFPYTFSQTTGTQLSCRTECFSNLINKYYFRKNNRESLGMRIGGGIGSNEGDTPIYIANIHPHGCIGKSKQLKVIQKQEIKSLANQIIMGVRSQLLIFTYIHINQLYWYTEIQLHSLVICVEERRPLKHLLEIILSIQ